jgi:starvation-inducible DNA-binding protein
MFEEQYRDLWNSIDDVAERIRALGQPAPGTIEKFKELAEIKENDRVPPAAQMLRELVSDNEAVARTIRAALSMAQTAGDEATASLLADRLTYHEKQVWMMKRSSNSSAMSAAARSSTWAAATENSPSHSRNAARA